MLVHDQIPVSEREILEVEVAEIPLCVVLAWMLGLDVTPPTADVRLLEIESTLLLLLDETIDVPREETMLVEPKLNVSVACVEIKDEELDSSLSLMILILL